MDKKPRYHSLREFDVLVGLGQGVLRGSDHRRHDGVMEGRLFLRRLLQNLPEKNKENKTPTFGIDHYVFLFSR